MPGHNSYNRLKKHNKSFIFRLPPALVEQMIEVAAAKNMTRQEAMIESINNWINKAD
jgi:hypothetical protein